MVDLDEKLRRMRERMRIVDNVLRVEVDPRELERLIDGASKVKDLEKVWKLVVPGFVRPLTMKDKGMLGHFATACGTFPRAAFVLAWTARNWAAFSGRLPQRGRGPDLRVLLHEAQLAISLAYYQPVPSQTSDTERRAVEAPKEGRMTDEERAAYLEELEKL